MLTATQYNSLTKQAIAAINSNDINKKKAAMANIKQALKNNKNDLAVASKQASQQLNKLKQSEHSSILMYVLRIIFLAIPATMFGFVTAPITVLVFIIICMVKYDMSLGDSINYMGRFIKALWSRKKLPPEYNKFLVSFASYAVIANINGRMARNTVFGKVNLGTGSKAVLFLSLGALSLFFVAVYYSARGAVDSDKSRTESYADKYVTYLNTIIG